MSQPQDLINLKIDDIDVSVPKGTTIIEAAKKIKQEIPHYCYHENLSIAGNCRMCQVEVEGAPKLMIACHTQVQPNMIVRTEKTSDKVKKAQADTLELILINHPLDCTVCDQSGHCKLQDYHYDYNAEESRFIEEKERKVKAEILGPDIILDGERCIMCTRCIRFCDEITKTSELGMLNRGDRSVIAINKGKQLDNDLSGTVVDLCPVGALTHRKWRFNTRIWYTKEVDAICTGCSTGCNVKVATRDRQVVMVKARNNQEVNKEWLCNEGRYGFNDRQPKAPLLDNLFEGQPIENSEIIKKIASLKSKSSLVFIAPDLTVEDYFVINQFLLLFSPNSKVAINYKSRELNEVQRVLVSPDYAANYRGAEFIGLINDNPEKQYNEALVELKTNNYQNILFIGDRSIDLNDLNVNFIEISKFSNRLGFFSDSEHPLISKLQAVFCVKNVLQKRGLLINRNNRLQYTNQIIDSEIKLTSEWSVFNEIAKSYGQKIVNATNDRDLTIEFLNSYDQLKSLKIKDIKKGQNLEAS